MTKSRNFEGKWYCSLTCHVIGATPAALRKHLEGRKLAFARALVAKGEHVPVSEPELEEEEEEEEEDEEEGEEGDEGSEEMEEASEKEEEEEEAGGGVKGDGEKDRERERDERQWGERGEKKTTKMQKN